MVVDFSRPAEKPDVRDVVLAAGVGAAADLDANSLDIVSCEACLLELGFIELRIGHTPYHKLFNAKLR